jgi:hypothetical protein
MSAMGRDDHTWRLDDADGVGGCPDRRGRRRGVVPRQVGRDDGGMMLPSLAPMLWRLPPGRRQSGETRLGRLTALGGVGYFFVWTVFGMTAFPLGVALVAVEMQQPALARAPFRSRSAWSS